MSNRQQQRRERTRKAIYDAAIGLFLEKGVDRTSMQDIADAADVARSTIFTHFATKTELLAAFYTQFNETVLSEVEALEYKNAQAQLHAMCDVLGRVAGQYKPIILAVASLTVGHGPLSPHDSEADIRAKTFLESVIARGQQDGAFDDGLDVAIAADCVLALITATNHDWVNQNQSWDLADAQKKRLEILLNGISA